MEQLVDDDGIVELWLGEHAQQILAIFFCEALDAQRSNTLQKTVGCEKLVDLTLDLRLEHLLRENVPDRGPTLLDNFLSDAEKHLLGYGYHLVLIDIFPILLHLLVVDLRFSVLIYLVMIVNVVLKDDLDLLDAVLVEVVRGGFLATSCLLKLIVLVIVLFLFIFIFFTILLMILLTLLVLTALDIVDEVSGIFVFVWVIGYFLI